MKKHNVDLKIKKGMQIDGIIDVFERESPIVRAVSDLKHYTKKLILIGIIYILMIVFIQTNFYIISIFVSLLFTFLMIRSVYKQAGEISYMYSKNIGGRKAKYIFRKREGVLQTMAYNITLMRKEEWRLINRILKVNHINNINSVKELKEYFAKAKPQEKHEIKSFLGNFSGVYLVPITVAIISIYTSIFNNLSLEQNIINILYIISGAIIIFLGVIPIYTVYSIKKLSFTNIYTFPRLEKLLIEILLNKEKNSKYYKTINR